MDFFTTPPNGPDSPYFCVPFDWTQILPFTVLTLEDSHTYFRFPLTVALSSPPQSRVPFVFEFALTPLCRFPFLFLKRIQFHSSITLFGVTFSLVSALLFEAHPYVFFFSPLLPSWEFYPPYRSELPPHKRIDNYCSFFSLLFMNDS